MKKKGVFMSFVEAFGYVALFIGIQRITASAASLLIEGLLWWQGFRGEAYVEAYESVFYGISAELSVVCALLFLGAVVLIHRRRFSERAALKEAPSSSLAAGALLGFASFLAAIYLIQISQMLYPAVSSSREEYEALHQLGFETPLSFWMDLAAAVLFAPITEEILCRGLIQKRFLCSMSPFAAIFLSAAIFAVIHGNLYQFVFTFPLGILLGYLAYRFRSIWPSVLLHMTFNFSNYPLRIAVEFGMDPNGFWMNALSLIWTGVLILLLPAAIITLVIAVKKQKKREPIPESASFESTVPHRFADTEKGENMAACQYLIVGLGNPGEQYALTRHNAGFTAIDHIAARQGVSIQRLQFRALTAQTVLEGRPTLLMKPQTFMNLSGESVREAMHFYKIPPERVLVLFDDINFETGSMRIRKSGSAGGHNGIKSIIASINSDAFARIKLGIGSPPEGWELMNWVLGRFSPEEAARLASVLDDVVTTARLFVLDDLDRAMAAFNRGSKTHTPKE